MYCYCLGGYRNPFHALEKHTAVGSVILPDIPQSRLLGATAYGRYIAPMLQSSEKLPKNVLLHRP